MTANYNQIPTYYEGITEKSPEIFSKSPNGGNRIKMYLEPLDDATRKLIRERVIQSGQSVSDRTKLLVERVGWKPLEANRIWEIYNESVFINGTYGLQRLERIRNHCCDAFRAWLGTGLLCGEPVVGIKCTFIDATVDVNPEKTGSDAISAMLFQGLRLGFENAGPHLFESFHAIEMKVACSNEEEFNRLISRHRGQISGIVRGGEIVIVQAELPTIEIPAFKQGVLEKSQDVIFIDTKLGGYRILPVSLEEILIREIRQRKGLTLEDASELINDTPDLALEREAMDDLALLLGKPLPLEIGMKVDGHYTTRGRHVTSLDLSIDHIGIVPNSVGYFTRLRELFLNQTDLEKLPETIGNLSSLEVLTLHGNSLVELPASIGKLAHLTELDLSSNQFSEIPQVVSNLPSLRILHLEQNPLEDFPGELGNITTLTDLHVDERLLNGNVVKALEKRGVRIHSHESQPDLSVSGITGPFTKFFNAKIKSDIDKILELNEQMHPPSQFVKEHTEDDPETRQKLKVAMQYDAAARRFLSKFPHDTNRLELALYLLERSIRVYDSTFNWDSKGCVLAALGRLDEARTAFLTAISARTLPTDQDKITWGKFQQVLQKLGDTTRLEQYKNEFCR